MRDLSRPVLLGTAALLAVLIILPMGWLLVSSLLEAIGAWRSESQAFGKLLPELKGLSQDIPEGSRRLRQTRGLNQSMVPQCAAGLLDNFTLQFLTPQICTRIKRLNSRHEGGR